MNKWIEILLGLVLVTGMALLGIYSSLYSWTFMGKSLDFLNAGWVLLKGGIFWMIIMVGILFIIIGISDLKG